MTPQDMQKLARLVNSQLPYGWSFVVLAFSFGRDGRMNYVTNAQRPDIVRVMYEFIEATKERWGEHVAALGAEDKQLARARQRIAQLEREIESVRAHSRTQRQQLGRARQRIVQLEHEIQAFTRIDRDPKPVASDQQDSMPIELER